MNKKKVILVDFEDSFTFNIANEVRLLGLDVEVVHYLDFSKKCLSSKLDFITIFGPGPGHPDEYDKIYQLIKIFFIENNNPFMGICLGHQLYWRAKGINVKSSKRMMHGECEQVTIPEWSVFSDKYWGIETEVQRYNSLVVDHRSIKGCNNLYLSTDSELLMSSNNQVITYQFHPESVGTSFPSLFFGALLKLAYTNMDERTY